MTGEKRTETRMRCYNTLCIPYISLHSSVHALYMTVAIDFCRPFSYTLYCVPYPSIHRLLSVLLLCVPLAIYFSASFTPFVPLAIDFYPFLSFVFLWPYTFQCPLPVSSPESHILSLSSCFRLATYFFVQLHPFCQNLFQSWKMKEKEREREINFQWAHHFTTDDSWYDMYVTVKVIMHGLIEITFRR